MWQVIKSNWNFMRILRLLVGIIALWQAILMKDYLLGAAGIMLMGMSVFNIGCCGANGCSTNVPRSGPAEAQKEITYETVDAEK